MSHVTYMNTILNNDLLEMIIVCCMPTWLQLFFLWLLKSGRDRDGINFGKVVK